MKYENKDMKIGIDGLGFALYSPDNTTGIPLESDFFEEEFNRPQDIKRHIKKGDVVGFCTGTSGDFILKLRQGYPDDEIEKEFPMSIRMGIEVKGGKINIVDVYWLMEFSPVCPEDQVFYLDDGFYHITLNTKKPESGIWGDDQIIYLYFNKLDKMPELLWEGIPTFPISDDDDNDDELDEDYIENETESSTCSIAKKSEVNGNDMNKVLRYMDLLIDNTPIKDDDKIFSIISKWYDENKYNYIINAILKIPEKKWSWKLAKEYICACNNMDLPKKAIECLENYKNQVEGSDEWHYFYAYALYLLNKYEEAIIELKQALEIDPKWEAPKNLLKTCKKELEKRMPQNMAKMAN